MKITADRTFVMADTHVPFHAPNAIARCLREATRYRPKTIVLNGDIIDCFSVSHWLTDPKQRNFKLEIQTTRQFLQRLRRRFPKAHIVYKFANHENRLQKYLFTHAAELSDLEEIKLSALLELKALDIEQVPVNEIINCGAWTILHGDEVKLGGAYPARTLFNKTKCNSIASHVHRPTEFYTKALNGAVIRTFTTPCLCQLNPDFSPYNDWMHGHLTVTDGEPQLSVYDA